MEDQTSDDELECFLHTKVYTLYKLPWPLCGNLEVVGYSGAASVLYIIMETSVGTHGSVRYLVDVRYWEYLLMESQL